MADRGDRPSLRRRVGQARAALDPRAIEGSLQPLFIFSLIALFLRAEEQALAVLSPDIRAEFGLNISFFGSIAAVVSVLILALAVPMGHLADRVRRVVMVRFSGLLSALAAVAQGLAPGVPLLVAGRLLAGAGQGIGQPAAFPLLTDYYATASRGRVFALFSLASQAGIVVGPLTAGLLGEAFGWRSTFVVLGGLAAIATLAAFALREPERGGIERREEGFHASIDSAADTDDDDEEAPLGLAEAFRAAGSIVTLRRIWYSIPFLQLAGAGTLILLPLYFSSVYLFRPAQIGLLLSVGGAAGALGLLIAGPVTDRVLADRPSQLLSLVGLSMALQGVVFLVLGFAPTLTVAVAVSLVSTFVGAVLYPASLTLISLVVPPRIRGIGLQTIAPWQLLGLALMPIVFGLAGSLGLREAMFIFAPLPMIGALIIGTAGAGVERDMRAARAAAVAGAAAREARPTGRSTLLVCRDVQVAYGSVPVLFGIDLDVSAGEIVALVGTNGAGKSSLLRAIAGLSHASGGAVFLDGQEITHLPPHLIAGRGVVLMPGGKAVFPGLTVTENLRLAAGADGDDDAGSRIAEVLAGFPVLQGRGDESAGRLSGGEQQLVGLAQALLARPRLLLVDELSLGLSPAMIEQVLARLREEAAAGVAIVIVEQSLDVALTIAPRAVFMERGEVRFDGPTAELRRQPHLVRSVFLGAAAAGPTRARTRARRPQSPGRAEPVLDVSGISVAFGGIQALNDVSVAAAPNESVGFIGPNGAGKTTLFDVISGFVAPDRGMIALADRDVTALGPETRARLGLVRSFQSGRLFPALTVREAIAAAHEKRAARNTALAAVWAPSVRASERRLGRRVDELVELLGLGQWAEAFVGELSTGTRRAVDVACAMALEPKVLLLDEPSSGLAQAETEALAPVLLSVVRQTGCALLVVEHDMALVSALADRLVAMELGAVIAAGPPEAVLADERVLRSYLATGSSEERVP